MPYLEKQGYKIHTIYPPESSEKNKAFMLALEGKYDKIIAEHLSPLAQKFIAQMKDLRSFSVDDNHNVFKGATFYAKEAVEIGLADEIASVPQVVEWILANAKKSKSSSTKAKISLLDPNVQISSINSNVKIS
jgi:protease-4